MPVKLNHLDKYINQYLRCDAIRDYCPNGLQVQGKSDIHKIALGVTACEEVIDRAIEQGTDALLVHHGYFWKNEAPVITGMKYRRLAKLIKNDISLMAYHLPLDVHPEVGNNVSLCRILRIHSLSSHPVDQVENLLWLGTPEIQDAREFAALIKQSLARTPLHIAGTSNPIEKIAVCTGGAQNYIEAAIQLGCNAFITGEASEQTFHIAQEHQIHFFAAGHHATERYGVQSLGRHLQQQFGLDQMFIEVDNPV